MTVPKVSVCIPTFNRAQFLPDAMESALAQTYTDFELVISDNASTDNTREVLARYRDPRIRIHVNSANIGLLGNFRRCLELARGEYFVILGSDDYWDQTLLARLVPLLDQNPGVLQAQTAGYLVSPDKRPLRAQVLPLDHITSGSEFFRRAMLDELQEGFLSSTLFRTAAVRAVGGFDPRLPNTQDFALASRLALEGDFGYIPEPLVCARKHPGNFHQNWDQAEYLKERLWLAGEIHRTWPRVREGPLAGVWPAANRKLAAAVLESMVGMRLAGVPRHELLRLLWETARRSPGALAGERPFKALCAIAFSPRFLARVISHFGASSRQMRQSPRPTGPEN